jgi:hypothetical protein
MVTITLGAEQDVRRLFSYPNNFNEVGYLAQSLEDTVETWLRSALARDGFAAQIKARIAAGNVVLDYTGPGEQDYARVLPAFLAAGALALAGCVSVNQAQKWIYNWRFLLPHGLAMVQHRTVQLLHFPPDYVLERDRDYLLAHTTTRWAQCLVENGADSATTDRYQTIVDIAPIAAPSDAGASLEGIYGNFTGYIQALLKLWLPRSDGTVRAMVAFGGPVKQWLKTVYQLDLKVLGTARLQVAPGLAVAILGANHPSFIYNAVKEQPSTGAPASTPLERGMRIMQQDLIAAGWQVRMGADPAADPVATLAALTAHWGDPAQQRRICELTQQQAFNKTPAEAQTLCAVLPKPQVAMLSFKAPFHLEALDAEIDRIRDALGPLDGREPHDIQDI